MPPSGLTCTQGLLARVSEPLTLTALLQFARVFAQEDRKMDLAAVSSLSFTTAVYTSPAPVPVVRWSTASEGDSNSVVDGTTLANCATETKQSAGPASVPLGHCAVFRRVAGVAFITPTANSPEYLRSATKNALCAGSAATIGLPKMA